MPLGEAGNLLSGLRAALFDFADYNPDTPPTVNGNCFSPLEAITIHYPDA